MGDVVECVGVLQRSEDPRSPDRLFLALPDKSPVILPVWPAGRTIVPGLPSNWVYEERDGRLYITPSLLMSDTGFHTDYNWSVAYKAKRKNSSLHDHFYRINPELRP